MNRPDQQAYDRGTSLYSPDGRIYQVEYAREAVARGAPSVGVRAEDGVALVAVARASSELMVGESIEKLHKLDDHVGAASAGHVADARRLVDLARRLAQRNRLRFQEPIGLETLTKEISDLIQEYTQSGGTRPFGAALLLGGIDEGRPRLFTTDPSGSVQSWRATVIGSDRSEIQEFLEAEYADDISVADAVTLGLRAVAVGIDDLEPADVSVATVSDDGYRSLSGEEIESHWPS